MKNLLFLALILVGLISCKERDADPNVLPEATQSGKNTGGALVDGKVWVAKIEQPGLENGGVNATIYNEYGNTESYLQIVLRNLEDPNQSRIRINILINQNISMVGNHPLNENYDNVGFYSISSSKYYTDSINTGTLTIAKLDKTNNIVSGTFSFKAKNANGQMVNITQGRFDKRFY